MKQLFFYSSFLVYSLNTRILGVEKLFRGNTLSTQISRGFSIGEGTDMRWCELIGHREKTTHPAGNYYGGSGSVCLGRCGGALLCWRAAAVGFPRKEEVIPGA